MPGLMARQNRTRAVEKGQERGRGGCAFQIGDFRAKDKERDVCEGGLKETIGLVEVERKVSVHAKNQETG